MRCLLIEHPSGLILIDTGAGNKESAKFHDIYGIDNAGADGRTALEDGLARIGMRTDDITLVINTHLHFDHAGGNSYLDASAQLRLSFPRARYVVQRGEFHFATHTNERTAASYFERNFVPAETSGRLDLIEGDREIISGVHSILTPGHTPYHQSILIESAGERALYLGDVIPTHSHLPLPWIMGYDVEPLVTLESKRHLLARAVDEQWLLIFEHDATVPWGKVAHDGKAYVLRSDEDSRTL